MIDKLSPLNSGLAGKRALVTGAAQGLGQAMAITLAREGASVVIHDRNIESTLGTVEAIAEKGGTAYSVAADLLHSSSIKPMVEEAVSLLGGGIDIVINNAGIGEVLEVSEMDEAFWDRMIDIDLKSPYLVTKYALESMKNNTDGGRVLFISSTSAKTGDPAFSAYAAAKAGILAFARCLASEVGPNGITVNAICPGWIDTPLSRDPIKEWADEQNVPFEQLWQETMADTNMMKSILTPADIAEFAAYLCSERGRHITAQAINVCGGLCYW